MFGNNFFIYDSKYSKLNLKLERNKDYTSIFFTSNGGLRSMQYSNMYPHWLHLITPTSLWGTCGM